MKEQDPKAIQGAQKTPLYLLPPHPIRELAHVLAFGAEGKNYGRFNWRKGEGIKISTYTRAILEHCLQYMEGQDLDEESGHSHLAHIMANCAILLDAEKVGQLSDDRVDEKGE